MTITHGILAEVQYQSLFQEMNEITELDLYHGHVKSPKVVFQPQKKRYYPPKRDEGKNAPMTHRGGAIYKLSMKMRWR